MSSLISHYVFLLRMTAYNIHNGRRFIVSGVAKVERCWEWERPAPLAPRLDSYLCNIQVPTQSQTECFSPHSVDNIHIHTCLCLVQIRAPMKGCPRAYWDVQQVFIWRFTGGSRLLWNMETDRRNWSANSQSLLLPTACLASGRASSSFLAPAE